FFSWCFFAFFCVSKDGFDIKVENNTDLKATDKGIFLTDEQHCQHGQPCHLGRGGCAAARQLSPSGCGIGAAVSERSAEVIAGILYPDKDIKDLSQEERQQISALTQLATGLATTAAGGDIQDINTGVAAGKNAVENNSLLGDRFREKHKNSVEYWKTEIREKIGENTASQILNGIMMSYGDTVDFGAGAADTALDAILALGSCTMGASYCDTALDDLGKANKTASDAMTSLINGDTWDHVRDVFAKAQKGEQRSLEEVASILTSILVPSKLAGNAGKVVNNIDDIVPSKTKAGKGAINNISTLNPNEIRFSQNTVSYNKVERGTDMKYTYDDLVTNMKTNGWKDEPVDVIKMPDGKFTSMDNTRIAAAREAGIDIKANVKHFDDKLSLAEVNRFSDPKKGFVPTTWGEAITGRINKQSGGFSKNNPYGSSTPPRISGKPKD
ncbi:VENN motif pre-toxin domain-containing protein, partial [Gilliamella sp. App4-10]|uniref:VENN motif pre-toxin domain-containing protein n=1 Tax=Gilliamella sp. App4-10 TaxID=3120231 RepID=UPI000A862386